MGNLPMQDMIVVVPGIMGSVLQKNGQDIWTIENLLRKAITAPQSEPSFDLLYIEEDSIEQDELGDGIQATRLIEKPLALPGFGRIGDYQALKHFLFEYFDLEMGNFQDDKPANYFEFSYDWRRYNSVAARKLSYLIEQKLELWRKSKEGLPDSKVIFIAHSMGGLVCRHYLEVLEGWKNCRLLITLGTPHRGSLDALERLCNGMKIGRLDLSSLIRSFPSVYELLPIYPAINKNGQVLRVTSLSELPINKKLTKEALAFHRKIETCVEQRLETNRGNEYEIVPIFGIGQSTLQSASWQTDKIVCDEKVPQNISQGYQMYAGDGTVPTFSAIPIELDSMVSVHRPFGAKHCCIQENWEVLKLITQLLTQLQTNRVQGQPIRGFFQNNSSKIDFPYLILEIQDYYWTEEPIEFHVLEKNHEQPIQSLVSEIELIHLENEDEKLNFPLSRENNSWQLIIPELEPGLYHIKIAAFSEEQEKLSTICDYFIVGNKYNSNSIAPN